jgi:large subunit ribosomal protein LP2
MKYLAAYALVQLSGKTPTKKDIEAVLKAAGASADSSRIDALFKELEGKSFDDLVAQGKKKLVGGASAPAAGAAAAAAPAAAAAGKPAAPAAKAPEPEEEDDDMGMGLFD